MFLLLIIIFGALFGIIASHDSGQVQIQLMDYEIKVTFWFALISMFSIWLVLKWSFSFCRNIYSIPKLIYEAIFSRYYHNKKQRTLERGLVNLALTGSLPSSNDLGLANLAKVSDAMLAIKCRDFFSARNYLDEIKDRGIKNNIHVQFLYLKVFYMLADGKEASKIFAKNHAKFSLRTFGQELVEITCWLLTQELITWAKLPLELKNKKPVLLASYKLNASSNFLLAVENYILSDFDRDLLNILYIKTGYNLPKIEAICKKFEHSYDANFMLGLLYLRNKIWGSSAHYLKKAAMLKNTPEVHLAIAKVQQQDHSLANFSSELLYLQS